MDYEASRRENNMHTANPALTWIIKCFHRLSEYWQTNPVTRTLFVIQRGNFFLVSLLMLAYAYVYMAERMKMVVGWIAAAPISMP